MEENPDEIGATIGKIVAPMLPGDSIAASC